MTLALRPSSMAKELAVGLIKNASYAWSKIYGDDSFDIPTLTKAYGLLMKSQEDYNVLVNLNNEYAIANRDASQIVNKVKVDRRGLNFFGGLMYWFNTAPDYVNRMSLFLAKMLKDGCYEAHSVDENGNLVYDPKKDKRFSYYLEMRDKYGMRWVNGDEKYNLQRSLYLNSLEEFNGERTVLGIDKLSEEDMLPRAYTAKEKDSIKSFTDTAYGYYDIDRSPLIQHKAVGIIFGQYLKFWPSFVRYYFGKPDSKSKRGHREQAYRLDDNGNKTLLYLKYVTDSETGEDHVHYVTKEELDPSDPVVPHWV